MSVIHCGWKIGQFFFLVVNIKVLFHPPSISHFDLVERKKGKFCHDFFYWGHNLIFYVSHSPQCIIATFLIWPSNFYIINFTVEKCLSIFCWVKTENWRIDLLYVHTVRNLHFLSKNSTLISREKLSKKIWMKNSWKCWGLVKIEFLYKNLTFRIVWCWKNGRRVKLFCMFVS